MRKWMHLLLLSYSYQNNDLFASLKFQIFEFLLGSVPLNLTNQKFNDRIKILNRLLKVLPFKIAQYSGNFRAFDFFLNKKKILRQGQNIIGSKITFI